MGGRYQVSATVSWNLVMSNIRSPFVEDRERIDEPVPEQDLLVAVLVHRVDGLQSHIVEAHQRDLELDLGLGDARGVEAVQRAGLVDHVHHQPAAAHADHAIAHELADRSSL